MTTQGSTEPPKPILSYGVTTDRHPKRNPFVHFLIIILGTVASFVAFFAGLIVFFNDRLPWPARMAGATAIATVLGLVVWLIARSWRQKRREAAAAAAQLPPPPPAPPMTRRQKIGAAVVAVLFWSLFVLWKLLPHLIQGWLDKSSPR
jgi:hypothetical protein